MKKVVIIVVPVVLVLAVVGFLFLKPKPAPADEKALAKEPGPVYTMVDPFVVNLADRDTRHFAKVGVALQVSKLSAGLVPAAEGKEPAKIEEDAEVRDIVIATLQDKTSDELGTRAGRDDVKKTIVAQVNKHTELRIIDVYFTEFAVQ